MPTLIPRSPRTSPHSPRTWWRALRLIGELLPALLLVVVYLTARERELRAKPWQLIAKNGRTEFVRWLPDSSGMELLSGTYLQRYSAQDIKKGAPIAGAYPAPERSRLLNVRRLVWRFTDPTLRQIGQAKSAMSVRAYAANGMLSAASDGSQQINVRTVPQGDLQCHITASAPVTQLALSPDAHLLAVGNEGGDEAGDEAYAEVWDAHTGAFRYRLRTYGSLTQLQFSSRATLISATGGQLVVWDAATGRPRGDFTLGDNDGITSFDFTPDQHTLALSGYNSSLLLVDVRTHAHRTLHNPTGTNSCSGVAFSPDGHQLAAATDSGIEIWDVATATLQRTLPGLDAPANFVALHYSPDSRFLAAQTDYGKVVVWSLH